MPDSIKQEPTMNATERNGSNNDVDRPAPSKKKPKDRDDDGSASGKRRCVSTACIACRKRKSKCDGNLPSCAACASVYHTPCVYDPSSDHRRKGVYKKDIDNLKTKNSTLLTLIQAILNYDEEDVKQLVNDMRSCENLEDVAASVVAKEKGIGKEETAPESPMDSGAPTGASNFESELSYRMGDMVLEGSVKFVGGTSNLIYLPQSSEFESPATPFDGRPLELGIPITMWTTVTDDPELVAHLMNMYFTWHYAYFTTLSKDLFYRDFLQGKTSQYCSALLVNAMLALGCHFTAWPGARAIPEDSSTAGDHFFKEAKRLLLENDELEKARLCTVQALALMSVREAGCAREGKGWVYSGMSFRMASDLGLNVEAPGVAGQRDPALTDEDVDARRITFWGCFLFDKCWSNYLGRQPQLTVAENTIPKIQVFPHEDAETWVPYTDIGKLDAHAQPARTRAVALHISNLCEISSDLLTFFYHPIKSEKPVGKQAELKKLTDVHTRLEAWRKNLPNEMEPKEGQLPQVLLMHMFFQLLFVHLYRPFLKYHQSSSPLPAHVSPRKLCTSAAATISKLFRIYKRTHGLHQICNIAIYIIHSACTIHLLNLPDKNARRDIIHGVKHLEEMSEYWLAARRTLRILNVSAERWKIELPEEALSTLSRTNARYGPWGASEQAQSPGTSMGSPAIHIDYQRSPIAQAVSEPGQQQDASGGTPQSQFSNHSIPQGAQSGNYPSPLAPPNNQFTNALNKSTMLPNSGYTMPQTNSSQAMKIDGNDAMSFQIPARPDQTFQPSSSQSIQSSSSQPQMRPGMSSSISAQITPAQQDAWNLHHARRTNAALSSTNFAQSMNSFGNGSHNLQKHVPTCNPAAALFGGVESLVAENRDWWLKDQSALAMGFENWVGSADVLPASNSLAEQDNSGAAQSSSRISGSGMQPMRNAVTSPSSLSDLDLDMNINETTLAEVTAAIASASNSGHNNLDNLASPTSVNAPWAQQSGYSYNFNAGLMDYNGRPTSGIQGNSNTSPNNMTGLNNTQHQGQNPFNPNTPPNISHQRTNSNLSSQYPTEAQNLRLSGGGGGSGLHLGMNHHPQSLQARHQLMGPGMGLAAMAKRSSRSNLQQQQHQQQQQADGHTRTSSDQGHRQGWSNMS